MNEFWPWLVLAEFVLILGVSLTSTLLFGRALLLLRALSRDKHFQMAPSFVAFMAEMAVLSAALLAGSAAMVFQWRPEGYASTDLVFWAGLLGGCLLPAVPMGVLFLSLDRICILCCSHIRLLGKTGKRALGALSVLSVGAAFLVHVSLNVRHQLFDLDDDRSQNTCWTFACLSGEFTISIYAVDRIAVAVPNFAASVALLTLLKRNPRNNAQVEGSSQWKEGDKIALFTAILLFLFDLTPSIANIMATYAFATNLSTLVGPYRQLVGSLNALGCALIYWRFSERQWRQRRQIAALELAQREKEIRAAKLSRQKALSSPPRVQFTGLGHIPEKSNPPSGANLPPLRSPLSAESRLVTD